MFLTKRRFGSQRPSKRVPFIFEPAFTGQGGEPTLVLKTDTEYIILTFEGLEEAKALLSSAHTTYHNVVDELHKVEYIQKLTQPQEKGLRPSYRGASLPTP